MTHLPALLPLLWALAFADGAWAELQEPPRALLRIDATATPPATDAQWSPVPLPDLRELARPEDATRAAWYRIDFARPAGDVQPWAVFLPYLRDGGTVWLNGALVARIAEKTHEVRVRWARPHLVTLPPALLRPGPNVLMLRAAPPEAGGTLHVPRPLLGPEEEVRPLHERRFSWVNAMPRVIASACLLLALPALVLWWRRRAETLYGLFGLAAWLWAVRTFTCAVEVAPADTYPLWRLGFHAATGGFLVAMTMLAWRLAGVRWPWCERAIAAYALAGPLWLLAQGPEAEPLVNRHWVGGLLPIGAAIVAVSLWRLVRRRTPETAALPVAVGIAALAGLHDYLLAWDLLPAIDALAPWAAQRLQLLPLAATLMLLAIGCLLAARLLRTQDALEDRAQALERRVAEREQELAASSRRLSWLEHEHLAQQERQQMLRELHDGLGSQLFVALSRVERGDMAPDEIAEALRRCIADLRLALDTVGPQALDLAGTLGGFLFRWRGQLLACGIQPTWDIAAAGESFAASPQATLQLLRVAQEALTNVVKHAQATAVDVRLRLDGEQLALEVRDDGLGAASVCPASAGRGLSNMQARARQLGGHCEVHGGSGGTRVRLQVPLAAVRA